MLTFESFAPGIFMAFDLFSLERSLFGFLGSLLLPVFLIVMLAGAMGGNGQNIGIALGEALGDALAGCLVLALDVLVRVGRSLFLALICLVSAMWRIGLSWKQNRSIKLKTGPEPRDGQTGDGASSGSRDRV